MKKTKKKNSIDTFWKKKSSKALIDVGRWLLTYGVATMIFSGVSLVYLEIYSLTTDVAPDYISATFLELYLGLILILAFYFIHRGSLILQKKIPIEQAHHRSLLSTMLLILTFIPLGWCIYIYKGLNIIFIMYLLIVVINLLTLFSLIKYQHRYTKEL